MKRIRKLYEEFIRDYSLLYDGNFVIPDDLIEYSRDIAVMQHTTLALCNAGRDEYNFLHRCDKELHPALEGVIPVATLIELVHPDDCSHFVEAWRRTFQFLEGLPMEKFQDYALAFECRLRDHRGEYHRILFKYKLLEHNGEVVRGQVMMILKPLFNININSPSREIYMFNIHTCKFVRKFNMDSPTERQIEVAALSKKGDTAETIARKLFISPNTVYIHRSALIEKTRTENIYNAAMYLQFMGII